MDIKSAYNCWLTNVPVNDGMYSELLALTQKDIEEVFYKDLDFGTGGIRAIMGVGRNRLNIYTVRRISQGYANYILKNNYEKNSICIAYDNRNMSYEFAIECAKILSSNNIKVYLFDSLRPTPELSFSIINLKASGGIVITASHNPKNYNGIKIYDKYGCQCVPRDTKRISENIAKIEDVFSLEIKEGWKDKITIIGNEVDVAYYHALEGVQENANLKKNIKIVYSPLHGTGNIPVQTMLKQLGYNLYVVNEQCKPDGNFTFADSINPENKKSFVKSINLAKELDADLVLNTDPDCDRIGVAVKHKGDYTYLTGNQTGAIILYYLLSEKHKKGTLPKNGIVFNTIVTSDLGTRICNKFDVKVESTLTGFKYIGDRIREVKEDNTFLFGYEESYGYLIKDICRDKDGVQAAIIISEICNFYYLQNKTLVDVLNDIYLEFGYVEDIQESKTFFGKEGLLKINEMVNEFRYSNLEELEGRKIVAKEDYLFSKRYEGRNESNIFLPKSNVIKFFLEDGSWVVIRPSGNEPKIKYYKNLWHK